MPARFPAWIRRPWASGDDFEATRSLLRGLGLHTVCQSSRCPNLGECWRRRTATIMVLGDTCTRACAFCAVPHGAPAPVDPAEPWNVAHAIRQLGLAHAVITSVTRDDLPDGGASHIASTIAVVRSLNPDVRVEVLVPDFCGVSKSIAEVLRAQPDVFGHNIETVARLYPVLRDSRADYRRSLEVLRTAATLDPRIVVKSALMVGHGETVDEVRETLEHLRASGCSVVCIGQYLQPAQDAPPVAEFVTPGQFEAYERLAYGLGFAGVLAGPLVRSSYRSGELWDALRARNAGLSAPGSLQRQEGTKTLCGMK